MNKLSEISQSHHIEIETSITRLDFMEKDFLKIKTKATLHDTVKVDEEKMISEINKIMKLIGINKLKLDDHI